MKKLIAIAFFAIVSVASSAQTSNSYQEVSFERFTQLKDSLSTDSLTEFEVFTNYYLDPSDSVIVAALEEINNYPKPSGVSVSTSRIQYAYDESSVNLLNSTYVCVTVTYELGTTTVALNVIASRLNVTWVDETIQN